MKTRVNKAKATATRSRNYSKEETHQAWLQAAQDWMEAREEMGDARFQGEDPETPKVLKHLKVHYVLTVIAWDNSTSTTNGSAESEETLIKLTQQELSQKPNAMRARLTDANTGRIICNFHHHTIQPL